jgi:predicted Zn-dependent protease with MMP-like domain
MTIEEIEQEAARVLERLPKKFRARLHNLAIIVEAGPTRAQLRSMGLNPKDDTLYGLYEGTPLSDRSAFDPPLLPDRITIFADPLVHDFPDPAELRRQIRLTLLHEIAHYFGMDETEIEDLGY